MKNFNYNGYTFLKGEPTKSRTSTGIEFTSHSLLILDKSIKWACGDWSKSAALWNKKDRLFLKKLDQIINNLNA